MPEITVPDWDQLFMTMAYLVATKSKDQSTHIGAVIIGPDREVRTTGYNSFPRGINDNVPQRQEHAERNAIFNAVRFGASLKGCTLYTNGIPCMDCARAIVQSGIKKVVVDKSWDDQNPPEWREHAVRTLQLFKEAGVKLRFWQGELIPVVKFNRGEIIG